MGVFSLKTCSSDFDAFDHLGNLKETLCRRAAQAWAHLGVLQTSVAALKTPKYY